MSSINTEISKVGRATDSEFEESDKKVNDSVDELDYDTRISNISSNGTSPSRSRYGRTIKPKSPKNEVASSPKNYKMPKSRRHQNSRDSSSDSIEENNVVNDVVNIGDDSVALNNTEDVSLKLSQPTPECKWIVGQLAWARVGNFPFWPCVVTLDPEKMIYHRPKGRTQVPMIHVQYFGDRGRHSWVSSNSMIEFTNPDDFKKLADSLTPEAKKKDAKYAAGFIIKPGAKSKWESAIEEAMEVQPFTDADRAKVFDPKLKESSSKLSKVGTSEDKEKANKRKYSNDSGGSDTKRTKQDNNEQVDKIQYKVDSPKPKGLKYIENGKNSRLNSDTPPSSPLSHRDSNDDVPLAQKVDFRPDEDIDGVFEVFYERNRDIVEDENPDLSEYDIKRYLKKTWDNMNSSFRKKYRSYIRMESIAQSKESSSEQEDDASTDTDIIVKDTKKIRHKVEKDETPVSETKKSRPPNLFRGMKQEKVCQICEKTGKLTRCKGPCYSYFHLSCVKPGESSPEHSIDENMADDKIFDDLKEIKRQTADDDENNGKAEEQEDESFKCIDCLSGVAPACFICNEREGDRIRCSVLACGKHYHASCLKSWPQSHWQGGRLTCSYHVCHTCSSDNPQASHSRTSEKLARCVRCPSAYHTAPSCLPAGSVILTGSQIVCPKHYQAPHPPVNAAWCFLCTRGGSLICCDTCPTSFHLECLGIDAPDGGFICEDCETGRLPLYGEVVWVKLGKYRWWPSRICYPHEIPENVEAMPHSAGKFCVMFLGSKNYYWVHRGRAFLYQDGDANIKPTLGKKTMRNDAYRRALEEANKIHQRLKAERQRVKEQGPREMKPPPYVKLKVNKPVGNVKPAEVESIVACDCDSEWENPCAPGTDCLNRILLVECSPGICPAGPKCNNQAFVRRQYPAMEPFHTEGRGWGLRSLENIQAGQFVIEYVGEVIDEAEYKRRLYRKKELKNENYYFLTIDNNRTIDAEPKGNLSRFMNHSCSPNCETQKWTVNGDTRIGLFALCDIDPGEELTFNYNLASDGETRKPCLCGALNCSGFIGLKVQKSSLSTPTMQQKKLDKIEKADRPEKIEKVEKLERVEEKSKRLKIARKQFMCWSCGHEIEKRSKFIMCDQKTCKKRYHQNCIVIEDEESRFSCPWHRCTECGRRTSAHCSFCSTACCQVHLEGNLFEYGEKTGFVCKHHEHMETEKPPIEFDKDYSDNDVDTDKDSSSIGSDSPIIVVEKELPREPSPRVSIVEVHPSSEDSEESQKEDDDGSSETDSMSYDYRNSKAMKKKALNQLSFRLQNDEGQMEKLNNLTSSQLEAIIGGSLFE